MLWAVDRDGDNSSMPAAAGGLAPTEHHCQVLLCYVELKAGLNLELRCQTRHCLTFSDVHQPPTADIKSWISTDK